MLPPFIFTQDEGSLGLAAISADLWGVWQGVGEAGGTGENTALEHDRHQVLHVPTGAGGVVQQRRPQLIQKCLNMQAWH